MTWLVIEWFYAKRPKFVGLLTGTVAGLATVTPAAGYVSVGSAAIMGVLASIACYYAVLLKNRMGWDDALDVWGVHGVGGFLGITLLGVFGATAWNAAGSNGLLYGNPSFFGKQVTAAILCSLYAFAFTYVALWLINFVTAVRVGQESEELGLDTALHGEEAYPLGV